MSICNYFNKVQVQRLIGNWNWKAPCLFVIISFKCLVIDNNYIYILVASWTLGNIKANDTE